MGWLVAFGSILGYLLVGVLYARSQIMACYRRAEREWWGEVLGEDARRESVNMQLLSRALLWPFAVIFDWVRGPLRRWIWRPYEEHTERTERLERDLEAWRNKRYTGTEAEQAVADDVIASLQDLLAQRRAG